MLHYQATSPYNMLYHHGYPYTMSTLMAISMQSYLLVSIEML